MTISERTWWKARKGRAAVLADGREVEVRGVRCDGYRPKADRVLVKTAGGMEAVNPAAVARVEGPGEEG